MSVIRVNKNSNYVTMNKTHFKEKGMSLKAKGLLSEMLSLPDDWDYSIKGLVAINKENINAIRSTLDELKRFKYLVIRKKLPNETDSGRIEYIYDIYEEPQKQEVEKQDIENQYLENQDVENQIQYNNIILNNNILNNKELNNKYNIYGEFKNVKLTDIEYKKLEEKNLLPYIERLSSYIASKGKKYKSHYATILNWSRNQEDKQEQKLPQWFDKDLKKDNEIKRSDLSDEEQRLIDEILGGNK